MVSFPSRFPIKTLYKLLLSPVCATCPPYLILLDLITQTILDEDTDRLAPHYVVFSIPLLPRPLYAFLDYIIHPIQVRKENYYVHNEADSKY